LKGETASLRLSVRLRKFEISAITPEEGKGKEEPKKKSPERMRDIPSERRVRMMSWSSSPKRQRGRSNGDISLKKTEAEKRKGLGVRLEGSGGASALRVGPTNGEFFRVEFCKGFVQWGIIWKVTSGFEGTRAARVRKSKEGPPPIFTQHECFFF